MAYTVTRHNTVFGNKHVVGLVITADAATQTIDTGLKNIQWLHQTAVSAATSGYKIAPNSNASGVQSYGVIGMSGLTSGDLVHVTVFGY